MEYKVEQVLGCPLLTSDLKVELLKALEVIDAVVSQKVQTKLNTFDFLHDQFYNL